MYCVKTSLNSKVVSVREFPSNEQRTRYLLCSGFVNGVDAWYHPFTKEVVGTFERQPGKNIEEAPMYRTCDKQFFSQRKGVYFNG